VPSGPSVGAPSLVGGRAEQISRTRGPACPVVTAGANADVWCYPLAEHMRSTRGAF